MLKKKKGQIWVETVVYTLIGLALIGLVLTIVMPKINESKDRIAVEQAIDSLSVFDEKINEVARQGPGNVRMVTYLIKRGELYINSTEDKVIFVISDLNKLYSESGSQIDFGSVAIVSEEGSKLHSVNLILDYGGITNLTYGGDDILKKFNSAPTPYEFSIENLGGGVISVRDVSEG